MAAEVQKGGCPFCAAKRRLWLCEQGAFPFEQPAGG
jgi:hypothetical protein